MRFNQSCEKTTGYTSQEMMGRHIWDVLLVPEEVKTVKAVFEELRASQIPNQAENYWVGKDGRKRLIAWSNTTLLNDKGEVEHIVGTGIDVTERRQAEDALKRQIQEKEALYRADEEMLRYMQLDQVLQTLVDVALDILGADKGSLLMWDAEQERLVVKATRGFSPQTVTQMSFRRGEGAVGRVATSGEAIVVEDTHEDTRVARRITDPEGIRSFIHVPIKIGGQVFGVFNADYCQPRAFGDDEVRLFAALAQRAALAIQNAQLYEQAQELAVVEERQRLARDLHDAVTQTLFSASLIAEVLPRIWDRDPKEGRRRLAEIRELTRGALAEMRTLLLELRPSALIEAELGDLLRQLGEAVTGRARVSVTVDVQGESAQMAPHIKVALYRVAQEALNNVAKHAGASQVTVSLYCGSSQAKLYIVDDGRGFDPASVPLDHLGLGIMRERAEAIGATLSIESEIGRGTKVVIVWPCSEGQMMEDSSPSSAQQLEEEHNE